MKYYVADAFAENLFEGNPAGVCILEKWISEELMQAVAIENNLSETAFAVKEGDSYKLRWFTPGGEIDLCGHATLGTAFIIMNFYEPNLNKVTFETKSGRLEVLRKGELYEMDFPAYSLKRVEVTEEMEKAIGFRPVEAWLGRDLVCVLENEEQIYKTKPNQSNALKLDGLLLQITAKGEKYDCVSRSFAHKLGIEEDPVCGSGHCHIIPLWAEKLKKETFAARQASKRGGTLFCEISGSRVKLAGSAILYSEGELHIENLIEKDV